VVVSVDVGVVSVGVDVVGVVSVAVELLSLGAGVVSVAVELELVGPGSTKVIPNAPEASSPAQSSAPNPRTNFALRNAFRPFISPAPLLPQIRRMN
jgi:hypothetical protein